MRDKSLEVESSLEEKVDKLLSESDDKSEDLIDLSRIFLVRCSNCSFNSSTLSLIVSLIFLRVFSPLSMANRTPNPIPIAVPTVNPHNVFVNFDMIFCFYLFLLNYLQRYKIKNEKSNFLQTKMEIFL